MKDRHVAPNRADWWGGERRFYKRSAPLELNRAFLKEPGVTCLVP